MGVNEPIATGLTAGMTQRLLRSHAAAAANAGSARRTMPARLFVSSIVKGAVADEYRPWRHDGRFAAWRRLRRSQPVSGRRAFLVEAHVLELFGVSVGCDCAGSPAEVEACQQELRRVLLGGGRWRRARLALPAPETLLERFAAYERAWLSGAGQVWQVAEEFAHRCRNDEVTAAHDALVRAGAELFGDTAVCVATAFLDRRPTTTH